MAIQQTGGGVRATLTVLISRDTDDDLVVGVTEALTLDGIAPRDVSVQGITPRINDLAIDVEADVAITAESDRTDVEVARDAFDDGFGITVEQIDSIEP